MDILNILKNTKDEIFFEDLDFFETELATGEYDGAYIAACKEQIGDVRKWLSEKEQPDATAAEQKKPTAKKKSGAVMMGIHNIAPDNSNPMAAAMSPEDIIFSDIKALRENDSYKTKFKNYVRDKIEIDDSFIDANYAFFMPWELDAIVSVKPLGEPFLEKYFGALDKDNIARHQLFSENFFIKHYAQMDASIVLEHGKNEWRKKENRSKQLDVFLRLKGVKI